MPDPVQDGAVRHPWFARAWLRLAPRMDRSATTREHRAALLAGLSGRVCEVGAGSGSNFAHYPSSVTEVLAVEPEPLLRAAAQRTAGRIAAGGAGPAITVVGGTAEQLPAADGSFDAVVASLVLCSVDDQRRALGEMHRVLRPRGELVLYEHVRSARPAMAFAQDCVTPLWARLAGGCHPGRDTLRAVEAAGFDVVRARSIVFPQQPPGLPHVLATAVRRDGPVPGVR